MYKSTVEDNGVSVCFQVRDLLNPYLTYSLAVRGSRTGGFYVENLSVLEFCDLEEFTTLLERGLYGSDF